MIIRLAYSHIVLHVATFEIRVIIFYVRAMAFRETLYIQRPKLAGERADVSTMLSGYLQLGFLLKNDKGARGLPQVSSSLQPLRLWVVQRTRRKRRRLVWIVFGAPKIGV